jgi:hypothetical protein
VSKILEKSSRNAAAELRTKQVCVPLAVLEILLYNLFILD